MSIRSLSSPIGQRAFESRMHRIRGSDLAALVQASSRTHRARCLSVSGSQGQAVSPPWTNSFTGAT